MHLEHTRFVLEETIQTPGRLVSGSNRAKEPPVHCRDLAPDLLRVSRRPFAPVGVDQSVGNAPKFTRNMGTFGSGFRRSPVRISLVGSNWPSVQDGIGVSPDKQAGLFGGIYQGDGSITRRFGARAWAGNQ